MKTADITPGVPYAYQSSKHYPATPVIVLDTAQFYRSPRNVSLLPPGSPLYFPATSRKFTTGGFSVSAQGLLGLRETRRGGPPAMPSAEMLLTAKRPVSELLSARRSQLPEGMYLQLLNPAMITGLWSEYLPRYEAEQEKKRKEAAAWEEYQKVQSAHRAEIERLWEQAELPGAPEFRYGATLMRLDMMVDILRRLAAS